MQRGATLLWQHGTPREPSAKTGQDIRGRQHSWCGRMGDSSSYSSALSSSLKGYPFSIYPFLLFILLCFCNKNLPHACSSIFVLQVEYAMSEIFNAVLGGAFLNGIFICQSDMIQERIPVMCLSSMNGSKLLLWCWVVAGSAPTW